MHSLASRANIVASGASTIACGLAVLIAVLSFLLLPVQPHPPHVAVAEVRLLRQSEELRYHYHNHHIEPAHYGHLQFNVTADFTPVFNWNVKQVFAYLIIEYESSEYPHNELVVWDTIIQSKADAQLVITDDNEYGISDIKHRVLRRLEGVNATLRLGWNIMPYVGILQDVKTDDATSSRFVFPKIRG